ncbi:hypothetical protein [Woodsholea maritima]|uniref:hypothetical protein n=1 Tax=Woodsholea maritima TaxID=240237 RepID=UPI00037AC299|nr:hypothetical protein [Woodsholea maritima]
MAFLAWPDLSAAKLLYSYAYDGLDGKKVTVQQLGRVIIFTFTGRYGLDDSQTNVPKVVEYARAPGIDGIVFNFQHTHFTHTLAQFRDLAQTLALAYPAHLRVAYTIGPGSLIHVLQMTRYLRKEGVNVGIRPCMVTALGFVQGQSKMSNKKPGRAGPNVQS